jgi:hypothetical protein
MKSRSVEQFGYRRGGSKKWVRTKPLRYFSQRYKKWVLIPIGYESDGATGAFDIPSNAWWVHDKLCDDGCWSDGTPINNWEASTVLADILDKEGRIFRARYWWAATWIAGCHKAQKVGRWPWS